jgi:hypothetical protein
LGKKERNKKFLQAVKIEKDGFLTLIFLAARFFLNKFFIHIHIF